jgi:hypothetical protein
MLNTVRLSSISTVALLASIGIATLVACGDAGNGGQTSDGYGNAGNGSNATQGNGGGDNGSPSGSSSSSSSNGAPSSGSNSQGGGTMPAQQGNTATAPLTNVFAGLPTSADQLKVLCARGGKDALTTALCGGAQIGSLEDLQKALGLAFKDTSAMGFNGQNGNPAFAMLSQSSSLLVRDVSAANPRAIIMTPPNSWQLAKSIALDPKTNQSPPAGWNPPSTFDQTGWSKPPTYTPPTSDSTLSTWPPVVTIPGTCTAWGGCGPSQTSNGFNGQGASSPNSSFAVLSYSRGEPFAEVAAHDPSSKTLRFFLVKFTPTCRGPACVSGDVYGPSVESSWRNVSVYEDVDIANTIVDCTHCHTASNGQKTLRMQEMANPWTHWMSEWTAGGVALLSDFHAVHGNNEEYGGIPAALVDKSEPRTLELLITDNGYAANASTFDSRTIETEVKMSSPAQPMSNETAGKSATWQALYSSTRTSGGIAAPYHDVKVADANKLGSVASQYQSFTSTGDIGYIPSMSNLFADATLVDVGVQPPANATGLEMIAQTCSECHNAKTDTSLGRARFRADDLGSMSRAEKDLAIARLQMSTDDVRHMPPVATKNLTPDQVAAVIDELSK